MMIWAKRLLEPTLTRQLASYGGRKECDRVDQALGAS